MTQQTEHAADRSARTGRPSFFDFSPIQSLLRRGSPSRTAAPRPAGIVPPTAEEARALRQYDRQYSLAQLREMRAERLGYEPPTLEPSTFPENRPMAEGTRVVIAASGTAPDREDMAHFLNGLKDAIPDLVLVHTGAPGAETLADDWARESGVPRIVFAEHPDGDTRDLRIARHRALIDVTGPSRFYDLSDPGEFSRLTEIARERHFPVVHARWLIEGSQVREPLSPDIDRAGSRVVIAGPGAAPDRDALSGFLDRLIDAIPDLVLVHGNLPGAERMTGEWAERNGVPQIVVTPTGHPADQGTDMHIRAMFHEDPVRVYDVSEPGLVSDVAKAARERGIPVADARAAVDPDASRAAQAQGQQGIARGGQVTRDRNMTARARISHSW